MKHSVSNLEMCVLAIASIVLISSVIPNDWHGQAVILRDIVLMTWFIHIVNWAICQGSLNQLLGIYPRRLEGLPGILVAHFLHGWGQDDSEKRHLFENTFGFLVLGWFILLQGTQVFYIVTAAVAIASGIGTWIFGRAFPPHVGASGVTYGYLGFVLAYGITAGNALAFLLSIIVGLLYGRLIPGILPDSDHPYTSWEMHLFGFMGGMLTAFILSEAALNSPPLYSVPT
ncbi:MAG: rhomboid family intramembrane serine protease [Synechococcales cyanobacterium T60_A2020_003]|nr:rhomboid family intramembrane serine protease [Synechococcales cyanobacterium T60_A2020_003]